jgi:hypothetical protein
MSRKTVDGQVGAGEAFAGSTLPTWQVAGLSLAVLVGHVLNGAGALVFGLVSVGVIWTLYRLHAQAPESRTTADLIASVPGAAPVWAIRIVQFAAYVLIGAYTATSIAQMTLVWFTDPDAIPPDGQWLRCPSLLSPWLPHWSVRCRPGFSHRWRRCWQQLACWRTSMSRWP